MDQRIGCEIEAAKALFEDFAKTLCERSTLRRLLSSYDQAIEETQKLMQRAGVNAACTACAAQEAGSCCFEGIETGYDRILLLVNLLLGCPLPDYREVPGSCLFVGKNGCRLRARYYFCVHYLCPVLQVRLDSAAKEALRSAVGKELAAGWELERAIRVCLRESDVCSVNSFN